MNKIFSFAFFFLCIIGALFSCSQDGEGGYWKSFDIEGDSNSKNSSGGGSSSSKAIAGGSSNSQFAAKESYCGEEIYNPETQFCSVAGVLKKCGNSSYDPAKEECCGTSIISLATHFCVISSKDNSKEVKPLCGGKTYNPDTQSCSGSTIININSSNMCGKEEYDPEKEECCGNKIIDPEIEQCCGGSVIDATEYFCKISEGKPKVFDLCNGKSYNPLTQFCYNNSTVANKCGGNSYNLAIEDCCGNNVFKLSSQFCYNSTIIENCGGHDYDPTEEQCCGSTKYKPSTEGCCDNRFKFNLLKEECIGGNVKEITNYKCNNITYNPDTEQCCTNQIIKLSEKFCDGSYGILDLCNGRPYNPSTQFCSSNEITYKCNGEKYDIITQRCNKDIVEYKCGSYWYNPQEQVCCTGTVVDGSSCKSSSSVAPSSSSVVPSSSSVAPSSSSVAPSSSSVATSGTFTDSRDGGKSYKWVKIGTQTWMAENLNYNAPDSRCYEDVEANCALYGRLYYWVTAVDLPSSCSSANCSSQIGAKHKGVCPSGWHLPNNAEWDTLMDFVNPNCSEPYGNGVKYCPSAGGKLKTTSSWYSGGNGTDEFGFSALPGGQRSNTAFLFIDRDAYWWSSTEYSEDTGYTRGIKYGLAEAYTGSFMKTNMMSVRCLKD